jgi:hypothetical protein
MRDFNPAYDRCGSLPGRSSESSQAAVTARSGISASLTLLPSWHSR